MCFVDLEKAYDRVPRGLLWGVLREYGVRGPLLRAIRSLYDQSPIECKFPESAAAAQQCSRAEGRLLIFQLTNKADSNLRLKKDDKYVIARITKLKIEFQHKEYARDAKVFPNGSFILGKATKNHSGDYMLEEHTTGGVLLRRVNLHLEIQALVSKPAVCQVCSSAEQRSISCSSEGEEVKFTFTLDGETLKHTRDQSQSLNRKAANMQGTKTKQDQDIATISLPGQLTGNLTCSVWNKVSREETVIHLNICKGVHPGFLAVRHGVGSVLLLALCLAVCIVHWKTRSTGVPEDASNELFLQEIPT
ncbi:uncharacterized protein LOC117812645 [Notolabrus celidotus]|uniref:uncharacterized protein LOC117812645 n=1 Tax=Notolabrus celidotus TaxID=1203425 RepID=UPI00148F5443|nr:uncharacterized protein LOC117812645 [Notolabrus celidotus]